MNIEDLEESFKNEDDPFRFVAIEKGINAVYTNDEIKLKLQMLAREVF